MQNNPSTNQPFRALAIDGGGMRGFYSAALLNALSQRFGGARTDSPRFDLGARCNLICGTSTGAILACGLAANVPLPKIMRLYQDKGPEIFPRPTPKSGDLFSWLSRPWWFVRHLCRPAANAGKLQEALLKVFGEKKLVDVYEDREIALCIPTIDAETYKSWVFKTPHLQHFTRDKEYKLVDVCMASASAPVFFPVHKMLNPGNKANQQGFVDGGLWANNATLVALVESLALASAEQEIEIIAVGTASCPQGNPGALKNPNWGIWQWRGGIEAINMAASAQAYGYDFIAKFIADGLSKRGRAVKIIRLKEDKKSAARHSAIGLDQADERAIKAMAGMAEEDASHIHSSEHRDSEWYPVVRNFFSTT